MNWAWGAATGSGNLAVKLNKPVSKSILESHVRTSESQSLAEIVIQGDNDLRVKVEIYAQRAVQKQMFCKPQFLKNVSETIV